MTLNREIRDVIIVGAGPAGCTLARDLAHRGVDVLILEKARLPRTKVCAGGITHRTASILGLDFSTVVEDTIYSATISFKLGQMVKKDCSQPLTYTVSRDRFDYLLAQKAIEAGAELHDGLAVLNVQQNESHVTVGTDSGNLKARIVAGADGAPSTIARSLELMMAPRMDVALEIEVPTDANRLSQWRGGIILDFGYLPPGYAWAFPKSSCLSIGAGGTVRHARRYKDYISGLLRRLELEPQAAGIAPKGHLMPHRRAGQAIFAGRCLLLGDAAGLIDPFTGEGIFAAVKSALLAAPAVENALARGPAQLRTYQRSVDRQLMPELRLSQGMCRVAALAPNICFSRFCADPRVWVALCRMLRGETTYSAIAKRLGPLGVMVRLAAI